MKNYVLSKLKCVIRQNENDVAIITNTNLLKDLLRTKNIKSKIIYVKKNKYAYLKNKLSNDNFKNSTNFQNLNFLFELSKHLKLNLSTVIKLSLIHI